MVGDDESDDFAQIEKNKMRIIGNDMNKIKIISNIFGK